MERINRAVELAMKAFEEENGEDAVLQDGDEFATVFNDGILTIGMEGKELKINFLVGKPYRVDFNLDMEEM